MRIRTDGDKAYREDTIKRVSNFYGKNKTDSMILAADHVPSFYDALENVLSMESLTLEQRREIAKQFNRARGLNIEVQDNISIQIE